MAEGNFTLDTFYTEWKKYQDGIKEAIAPLTEEQLALRAAPHLRSIGELAMHIIGARMSWLAGFLGENDEVLKSLTPDKPMMSAAELAKDLDVSWSFMMNCLTRWSADDMRQTFQRNRHGSPSEVSRSWVIWHLLEHDLHHGGEISLTLGINGLQAPDI